jgi:3-oxoacyl-[acyl-carrier protein] reductase
VDRNKPLAGRSAIVTGSSSGIGRGIAIRLAKDGASVAVNFSKSRSLADEVVSEIKAMGGETIAIQADVSDTGQVDSMVSKVTAAFGRLDILVNNAGVYLEPGVFADGSDLDKTTDEIWDRTLDVNLKGTFLCSRRSVPEMLRQGKGKIINISSIDGLVAERNSYAYAASKAGVIGLTKALALDLAPKKINVNAIAPGQINTPQLVAFPELMEKSLKLYLARTPSGRIGQPEDIASAAAFLASDESDFMHGSTMVVDGGWLTY